MNTDFIAGFLVGFFITIGVISFTIYLVLGGRNERQIFR